MKTAVINIKTDPRIKKEAQKTAKELGLSLSDVLNASLRDFIVKKEVTYRMKPSLEKILGEVEEDMRLNQNFSPGFSTAEEAIAYLRGKK